MLYEVITFKFWINRLKVQSMLFDFLRIDHFRGFEAFWEIPAAEETAINGHWVKAPGERLFAKLTEAFRITSYNVCYTKLLRSIHSKPLNSNSISCSGASVL